MDKILTILMISVLGIGMILMMLNFVTIFQNQRIIDKTSECIDQQLTGSGFACDCVKETVKMMYEAGYNNTDNPNHQILLDREELLNENRWHCQW